MTATTLQLMQMGGFDPSLLAQISHEVSRVEAELRVQTRSSVEMVEQVGRVTLEAGGKRIRPAMVVLAAKVVGNEFDDARCPRVGAVMEMIHMATLVHDDVIDGASTRRGRPTAGSEVGNTAAVLGGDVLLARAMSLLSLDGDLDVIRTVSDSVVEMVEGEVEELVARGDFDLSEETHIRIMQRKTGAFIRACCEVGAIIAHAAPRERAALGRYGHHVGLAFQIVDDILDYRGSSKSTGKPLGTDFRDGQATLPLIYLRPHLTEAEATIARRRFASPSVGQDEVRMIRDWMESRGAFKQCEELARYHVAEAHAALAEFADSKPRRMLSTLADYVITRNG